MTNLEKISFAINQISVNNCDGSANENGIKAVAYLQEVHHALSQHDVIKNEVAVCDCGMSEYCEKCADSKGFLVPYEY